MPKVSVIMPCYNVETYLKQCLDSVLNQTLTDIEVICVDDGSTDSTLSILEEYKSKDQRLKILQQNNLGAGAARNNGLKHATGKYLSFLDSDDFFHPQMLEKAVERANQTNAQIIIYRTQRYWENSNEYVDCPWTVKSDLIPNKSIFSANDIELNFFNAILGFTWDKLFEAEYVKENHLFFQELSVYNDAYFVYSALLKAKRISLIDEVLCYQRKRASQNSITNRRSLFFDCAYTLLGQLKKFLIKNDLFPKYQRDFINYSVHLFSEDLSSRRGKSRQTYLSYLRSKWFIEFDLIQDDSYYYDRNEYQTLYKNVYHTLETVNLDFVSLEEDIVIPVVYATDMGYLNYTIVSMCSILRQPTINIRYRLIVLVPQSDIETCTSLIENTLYQFTNYSLEVIGIGSEFDHAHLEIAHITTPTYYRLLLPDLLPDCDKCIYIDGDTVACEDLFTLYATDLGDNYIGAVEAFIYYERAEYHSERLGTTDKNNFVYYNAGVLLMNLEQMRKDNMVERFMTLVGNNYESQDQDIINIACSGRIKSISPIYNVMTRYHKWDKMRFINILGIEKTENYLESVKKPVIIHYADKIKPWNNMRAVHAKYWWETTLSSCWDLFAEEKTELVISTLYNRNHPRESKLERAILFIPRKIRGGIKCCQDHGLIYTIKYIPCKITRWLTYLIKKTN